MTHYRKVAGFALMFLASLLFSQYVSIAEGDGSKTFLVKTDTIPFFVSHVHPEGEPDAPHAHWYNSSELSLVPEDMWVTSIKPIVLNAPLDIMHHVLLHEPGIANKICPNTFTRLREWYSASMNTARDAVVFEEPYGIFFKKGTPLVVEAMEHTAELPQGPGGMYANVTIAVELTYIPSRYAVKRKVPVEFYRLRLDDTPCAYPMEHEAFKVPAGAKNFIKTPAPKERHDGGRYVFEEDGEILGFGSNFWPWKGGKEMRAMLNGKQIAALYPEKLNNAWAWRIPQDKKMVSITAGDIISAEMVYENPYEDTSIKDASGMLGFYFASDVDDNVHDKK